jgi:hypothetical protein
VAELERVPNTTVVCLAGRNELVRDQLEERFAHSACLRVLGFTDRMPELLAATDVLVHSTGGVTCLEALASGCHVVSYGLPVGHAKCNTRRMAEHDIVALANSAEELVEHVERNQREGSRSGAQRSPALAPRLDAADVVLSAVERVRPLARWRMRAVRLSASLVLALSVGTWLMSTDEIDAFAAVLVGHPLKTVDASGLNDAALIVRAPMGQELAVANALGRAGVHATFASVQAPNRYLQSRLAALGDDSMPAVKRSSLLGWIHTPATLRHDARALNLHHRFYYLAPRNAALGQLLLAHIDGAVAVVGSVQVDSRAWSVSRPLRAGDVVVLTLEGSSPVSLRTVGRVVASLDSAGLSALPLSSFAG